MSKRKKKDPFESVRKEAAEAATAAARRGDSLEPAYWAVYDSLEECGSTLLLKIAEAKIKALNAIHGYRQAEQMPKRLDEYERKLEEVTRELHADRAGLDDTPTPTRDRPERVPTWCL